MSRIKGANEYAKWEKGEKLTLRQALLTQCYVCNGLDEGGKDCKGKACPLYPFMPYNRNRYRSGRTMTPEQREAASARLREGRKNTKLRVNKAAKRGVKPICRGIGLPEG